MTAGRPPVAACRSCGESIIWCRTETDKRMPVDLEPAPDGNLVLSGGLLPTARPVSRGGREPGQVLHKAHFATCRKVADYRRKQTARQPRSQRQAIAPDQGGLFGGGR